MGSDTRNTEADPRLQAVGQAKAEQSTETAWGEPWVRVYRMGGVGGNAAAPTTLAHGSGDTCGAVLP